eukprot:TRINITY_DN6237_c0_g1_i2.p2 TRINITY_DN6237_c0_g1~~TRINITY_DN6237_c0_g1_i2.p2  ORF type:complete len:100 (-),score=0.89 TRINITY_DN6237_c0_g1_i2:611-910(-)
MHCTLSILSFSLMLAFILYHHLWGGGLCAYMYVCMYVYTCKGLSNQHHETEIIEWHGAVPVVSTSYISNISKHLIGLSFYPSSLSCLPFFFFFFYFLAL